ncbi:hypothetical protein KY360_00555 [Candidatus Woesearchaeota archaeon]|nr:hypothetical protein [Candidatus Woesearchaeota archaeon]
MMETMAVLFVFFILIALGFVFYANMLKGSLAVSKIEQSELRAIELAEKVSSLPELQCSEDNNVEGNCIDILKLSGASEVMQTNYLYYFDILGYSEITIDHIYPPGGKNYTVYSNIPLDYEDRLANYIPISIKNPGPVNKGYGFAIMNVMMYSK